MKIESLMVGGASVVAAMNATAASIFGMPIGGIAACFFGAAFGVLYLPTPTQDGKKSIPFFLALPVLWGVGVFGGSGLAALISVEKPVIVSFIGMVLSAAPVPIVRGAVDFAVKKFGG